jgi:signal recognition particle subunit SRP54
MGDIVSLVEEASHKVDKQHAEKMAKKLKKGKRFDLEDFLEQLAQMKKMGGIAGLMSKIPGMNAIPQAAKEQVNDKSFTQMQAIIQSMTPQERRFPDVIKGSRKRRIALGSGTEVPDINRLLKQFDTMQKMMQKMNKGGLAKMLSRMPGGGGMMPPGMGGMPPLG